MSSSLPQRGLKWTRGLWETTPSWTVEPDMAIVHALAKPHLPCVEYGISFFAAGAFNKLYLLQPINTASGPPSYLMRVTLPVDPYFKTASEVATLQCVRRHTTIPVPEVIAYNASADNELGFEWILMTRLNGVSLRQLWETPDLSWEERVHVTETVAAWVSQLHQIRSDVMGSLFLTREEHGSLHWLHHEDASRVSSEPTPASCGAERTHFIPLDQDTAISVGPVVAPAFFYGNRIHMARDRGPFTSCPSWLSSLLELHILEVEDRKAHPPEDESDYDSDDVEELDTQIQAGHDLLSLLPTFFPRSDGESETFVLHHNDISTNNILIDPKTHQLQGLVDWESIYLQPIWKVECPPQFLFGPTVDPGFYETNYSSPLPSAAPLPDPSETNSLLCELRENIEKMLLRRAYYKTMHLSNDEKDVKKRVYVSKVEAVEYPLERVAGWAKRVKQGANYLTEPEWGQGLFVWEEV